jgi:two-component system, LytTR family, sensor kinase
LLRRTLHTGPSQEVSLEEELALVKSYVAVMEERFGDDLKVEFKVDPGLIHALVPQLILQPLVENSIRHALHPQSSALRLRISASQDKNDLLLQVHDDGPGLPLPESFIKGIGLSNTEQRLRRLYGTRQQMLFENAAGLRVTIRLPFHVEAVPA